MKPVTIFNIICFTILLLFVSAFIGAINPGMGAGAAKMADEIYWGILGSVGVIILMIIVLALLVLAYWILCMKLRDQHGGGWNWMHEEWLIFGGATLLLVILVVLDVYIGLHWGFSSIR